MNFCSNSYSMKCLHFMEKDLISLWLLSIKAWKWKRISHDLKGSFALNYCNTSTNSISNSLRSFSIYRHTVSFPAEHCLVANELHAPVYAILRNICTPKPKLWGAMETFLMEMADFQAWVLFHSTDVEKQKKKPQTKLEEKQNKNNDKRCIFSP